MKPRLGKLSLILALITVMVNLGLFFAMRAIQAGAHKEFVESRTLSNLEFLTSDIHDTLEILNNDNTKSFEDLLLSTENLKALCSVYGFETLAIGFADQSGTRSFSSQGSIEAEESKPLFQNPRPIFKSNVVDGKLEILYPFHTESENNFAKVAFVRVGLGDLYEELSVSIFFAAGSLVLGLILVVLRKRLKHPMLPILISVEMLLLTSWFSMGRSVVETNDSANRYQRIAQTYVQDIQAQLKEFESSLSRFYSLATNLPPLNQTQFEKLAGPFLDTRALRAIEWVEKKSFSPAWWTKDTDGRKKSVAPGKAAYYPIVLAHPLSQNIGVLNFDLGSEITRHLALEKSLLIQRPVSSDIIYLVQDQGKTPGFLTLCPIYSGPQRLVGIVVGVIDAQKLFRKVTVQNADGQGMFQFGFGKYGAQPIMTGPLASENFKFASFLYDEIFEFTVPLTPALIEGARGLNRSTIPFIYLTYAITNIFFILVFLMMRQRRLALEAQIADRTLESERNESHFNRLFDSSPIAYLVLEGETIVFSNNRAQQLFGNISLGNKNFFDFSSKAQADGTPSKTLFDYHIQIARIKGASNFEWTVLGHNSALRWMEASLAPFETYMLLSLNDITNRKELETALLQSTERFNIASDAAKIGVWEWSVDDNLFFCDERLYRIFGIFNKAEIKSFADFSNLIDPSDRVHVQRAFTLSLGKRQDLLVECSIRKNDSPAYFRLYGKLSRDTNVKTQRIVGIALEITAQRQVEQDLRYALDRANAATKAKSEFLANMSHEIRTPLNGILGVADLLAHTKLDEEQGRFTKTITNSGNILLEIINDILDLSKIEAGRLELEQIEFDLPQLLVETLRVLSIRAEEKDVELIYQVGPKHPTIVRGDKNRLRQVITNLVGNAIKFTRQGHIKLSYSLKSVSRQKSRIEIAVSDTGIGIPSDKLQVIFDKFTQVDASTTRKFGGTGLGLSICKELCAKMGGELSVESILHEGSTFKALIELEALEFDQTPSSQEVKNLTLVGASEALHQSLVPFLSQCNVKVKAETTDELLARSLDKQEILVLDSSLGLDVLASIRQTKPELVSSENLCLIAAQTLLADETKLGNLGITKTLIKPFDPRDLLNLFHEHEQETKGRESTEDSNSELSEFKVLLVEDNLTNQLVARALLQRIKGLVTIANNGQEALDHLEKEAFDLIFMDIQMPILDGFEATKQFHEKPERFKKPKTPVVAMTAHALSTDRDDCLRAGMDDYVSKPVHVEDLVQMVKKWVGPLSPPKQEEKANPSAPTNNAFDSRGLRARVLGEKAFAVELIGQFDIQANKLMDDIDQAHKIEDFAAIKSLAHKLKGSALTMGGTRLGQLANELEKAAVYHNAWDIAGLEKSIATELATLQENLKQFISDWKA